MNAPSRPGRDRARPYLVAGLVVLALGVAGDVALHLGTAQGSASTQGPASSQGQLALPSDVPAGTAELMGLQGLPSVRAPNFALVDQYGRSLSLSALRGRPVVLEFMDPHCTDICPIVSREFLDAYRDLGSLGRRVVFLAVNVNRYHLSVSAVRGFTDEQGLEAIPTWHFVTGPLPALRATWKAYGIYVHAPGPNADVQHGSEIYFISAAGKEKFIASPTDDHTAKGRAFLPGSQQVEWGKGIAEVLRAVASQGS